MQCAPTTQMLYASADECKHASPNAWSQLQTNTGLVTALTNACTIAKLASSRANSEALWGMPDEHNLPQEQAEAAR